MIGMDCINTNKLVKERDEAFTDFVLTGNETKLKAYCKRYGVKLPKNPIVRAGGVYKAVQHCTNIQQDVKEIAVKKCMELGMNPFSLLR